MSLAHQSEIFRIQRWLADAKDRLFELEFERTPWAERSVAQRAVSIAKTTAFWAGGLVLTFVWSAIAFAFFAATFVLAMFGWWKRVREIRRLRVWIDGAETTLADAGRRGYALPHEHLAIADSHKEDQR